MDKPFLLYNNLLRPGFVTATGTAAGYNANHVADLRTFTKWRGLAVGTNYVNSELYGSNQPADTVAIIGHNLGTEPATVTVEGFDGATWATVATVPTPPASNGIIVYRFTQANKLQYRLKVVTATVVPEIGVLMIGARLDFPIFMDSQFKPFEETIVADSYDSKNGNLLGTVIKFFPWDAIGKFTDIPADWHNGAYKDFWDSHGRYLKPFVWVPAQDEFPEMVFFGRFDKSQRFAPTYSHTKDLVDKLDLKIEGVIYGV